MEQSLKIKSKEIELKTNRKVEKMYAKLFWLTQTKVRREDQRNNNKKVR